MAKKTLARDQDKFLLRLPDGLRDRIKAKAERAGMSMNEAIIWVLEREFPAPMTLDAKIEQLATMVAMLRSGGDAYEGVDRLVDEIHDTVAGISEGKLESPPEFRKRVSERLERWQEEELENWNDQTASPFDIPESQDAGPNRTTFGDDSEEPFG